MLLRAIRFAALRARAERCAPQPTATNTHTQNQRGPSFSLPSSSAHAPAKAGYDDLHRAGQVLRARVVLLIVVVLLHRCGIALRLWLVRCRGHQRAIDRDRHLALSLPTHARPLVCGGFLTRC
jgi:hypothetical protein